MALSIAFLPVLFGECQLVAEDAGFHSVVEDAGHSKHVTIGG